MTTDWRSLTLFVLIVSSASIYSVAAQAPPGDGADDPTPRIPAEQTCNGVFIVYAFISRTKEFPHLKNATAQPWSFKSAVRVTNTGTVEVKAWKVFVGFQHKEILVSAGGAVLAGADDFPAEVGNGTYLAGYPQTDLMTSIETAGDINQIQAVIQLLGTQFGVKPPNVPMPKTIRLVVDGFKCPAPTTRRQSMYACCVRDPKYKVKQLKTKLMPRQNGDLSFTYDIIQAYPSNYLAQVTIENTNPLGRLDQWNLTWEWMRGEFIYTMRGAYTHKIDYSDCIYGQAAQYYQSLDFSQVMNCQKKPVIADLPRERANDTKIGKLPNCCRNGTLLPTTMDKTQSKSVFQLQVYKLPPDMNRTALSPPEKWKIVGLLNPDYKCGAPIRVDASEFPDPSGLPATTSAIATWQVVCNITKPTKTSSHCCVSFSAYYNSSVIPCNTCACGCNDDDRCNRDAPAMLLPSEAILVPFANRTIKAVAWAKIKHFRIPRPLPCGDNCGVSMNWHLYSDYRNGWSARITLFNWERVNFPNWFAAIQLKKSGRGFDKAYSFNGTLFKNLNNTIFLQGLVGSNDFLIGEMNASNPSSSPPVPGKLQSVLSFTKKLTAGIDIPKGDGFPTKVLFNGEECSLPTHIPTGNSARNVVSMGCVTLHILVSFVVLSIHQW